MKQIMVRNRLGEIIKGRGISNIMLAILLEVHVTTISQWISNRQQPSKDNIVKLMRMLELRYNDIMIEDFPHTNKGIVQSLQNEYNKIIKVHPPEIEIPNETGGKKKVLNPNVVTAMKEFERELMKKLDMKV